MHCGYPQNTLDRFNQACQANGLRITPQRAAIYEELAHTQCHPSAEKVLQAVRQRYPNISLDTVNRTLQTFAEIGLIHSVEGHGDPRRFDGNVHPHHHMHCVRCHKIVDFDFEPYDRIEAPECFPEDYSLVNRRVILNVVCGECRTKD